MAARVITAVSFFACISATSIGFAQDYFGGTAGFGQSKIFIPSKEDRQYARIPPGNAFQLAVFYETPVDSEDYCRTELQYQYQQLALKIDEFGHFYSYHRDVKYTRQLVYFNLEYVIRLGGNQFFKTKLLIGPSVWCNVNTYTVGTGTSYADAPHTGPDGQIYVTETSEDLSVNSHHSKDLYRFGAGLNFGLEFSFRLSERMDLLIQNKYGLGITTTVLTGYLNLGLRRQIGR